MTTIEHRESYTAGPREPEVQDISVGDLLRRAAANAPGNTALVEGIPDRDARRRWTYLELLRDAEQCAKALLSRFSPGDHIAVWAPNVPEYTIFQFGAALAGMVMVTINPTFRRSELRYALEHSGAVACFSWPSFRDKEMLETAGSLVDELSTLREVIDLQQLSVFLESAGDAPLPVVDPGSPAQIQYTSGTTGTPKGAVLHHRGIANDAWMAAVHAGGEEGENWLCLLPLFHVGGCVFAVLGSVALMGTIVPVYAYDAASSLQLIEEEQITLMSAVPTMLLGMMQHPDIERRDLASLQTVISGGAPVPAELVRRIEAKLGVDFTIIYGQTEISGVLTGTRVHDTAEDKAETCGVPIPGIELRVVDPSSGETLPRGQVGELVSRGYSTMLGYHDDPEATSRTIDSDRWLHTGDLAVMDDRGFIRVVGRLKDMVIRGGENLYPREIEEELFRHPAVKSAAVVGLPDDHYGEIAAAFLQIDDTMGGNQLVEELRHDLRQHLSGYKVPGRWFVVDEYPQTASGKIRKFEIRQRWAEGEYETQEVL